MGKGIKVLMVNPVAGQDEGSLLIGVSTLIALLKNEGHTVELFDTTQFKIITGDYPDKHNVKEINEKYLNFVPVKDKGLELPEKEQITEQILFERFSQVVNDFSPDVIAISILCSYNYRLARKMMENLGDSKALCIVGGKHISTSYNECIEEPFIDALCIGDGERPLALLCRAVADGNDYMMIEGLWVKTDNSIVRNGLPNLIDLDEIPFPDWSCWHESLFYKPFRGRMYRYGYMEISRGCPFKCTYCHNSKEQELLKGLGKLVRTKSITRVMDEIRYLKETYSLELIKFFDEDFLAKKKGWLNEFARTYYKKLELPFLVQARPERMTKENAQLLKEMGCIHVSIGVESGNDYMRKDVYGRNVARQVMVDGFKNFREAGIYTTALNIIGGPYETKEQIFDTIQLNRELEANDKLVSIFQPFKGTALRDLCIKEGFISKDEDCIETTIEKSVLNMPQISKDEIWGFRRTFALYTKIPKLLYPLLHLCRKYENSLTDKLFFQISKIYG